MNKNMRAFAPCVDWRLIADALEFFEDIGYTRVDVPWAVPFSGVECTRTAQGADKIVDFVNHRGLCLVGSSEQSMCWMRQTALLSSGSYVTVTPCFRREPVIDERHLRCFMKVELMHAYDLFDLKGRLESMMIECSSFFSSKASPGTDIETIKTGEEEYDILANGIEIGSYGIRKLPGSSISWAYGTGIAEPRFTFAVHQCRNV